MEDGGKYSLVAENKNGRDVVDLDLIVVDEVPVGDCDMFLHGTLECRCHLRWSYLLILCAIIMTYYEGTAPRPRRWRWRG